ncbi:serine/threonine-protein kinase [Vitiosangium sp. GDMCC 1.1324]|uniref:serine/threonine-protein kinase n=1 Tax=Vitiosangium sp. (strain GDMCC 1.1324) TaxID=2138576 RepID=UPI000D3B3ED2|nr:serine/threonine-protein kinase [Vitiosangium sp. GDMCC 1.1324]PTL84134.1 serine/threonine protein kinase [Vitiosangium sp. GDMCC 1.1324]
MSEAVEGQRAGQAERKAPGRLPRRRAAPRPLDAQPPPLGTTVDGYRLEARLGEGGQGTVYRARRGGRLYAIKFLSLASPDWAWRELEVRLRLRRVGELAVEGHGLCPHRAPRFLYLVTPYVHGRPLYAWTKAKNPTARQMARVVLEVARQLVEVHRAGVVHRDVKGTNVLVRNADGRPVLVDFGVSTYVGAPEITHPWGMPGTRHYRSPEALRFRRERAGEHSPARPSDDLWALGVVLYWLLTGGYPFDTEVADEGALADLILKQEPETPHTCNPRVPRALSELCLRMLEKRSEARFPNAQALAEALEALLAEADGTWDVALCEEWSEDGATTPQDEWLDLGDWRDKARRLLAYAKRYPRRGRPVPVEEASTLPRSSADAPPGGDSAEEATPSPRRTRIRLRRLVLWGAAVLGLGLLAALVLKPRPEPEAPVTTPGVATPSTMPEVTTSGQEVARREEPPEGGRGAAPEKATTPAPVASATPPEDSTRMKTPQQTPQPRTKEQEKKQRTALGGALRACGTAITVGQVACASPAAQVRTQPPQVIECPPDAVQTMKDLGLKFNETGPLLLLPYDEMSDTPALTSVRPGPATLTSPASGWGKLPGPTVFSGVLFFGETHVYGRFTSAHTPDGHTYPVCMELWEEPKRKGMKKKPDGAQDTATVLTGEYLKPVERFQ